MKLAVRKETPLCKKFQDFLRNGENKTELFIMIADAFSQIRCQKTIIATAQEDVMSNDVDTNLKDIMLSNQEEADTRLLLHVFHACKKGFEKVSIITADTDVVVIALYHYSDLQIDELWVRFDVGEHKRWLPIHDYVEI